MKEKKKKRKKKHYLWTTIFVLTHARVAMMRWSKKKGTTWTNKQRNARKSRKIQVTDKQKHQDVQLKTLRINSNKVTAEIVEKRNEISKLNKRIEKLKTDYQVQKTNFTKQTMWTIVSKKGNYWTKRNRKCCKNQKNTVDES